MSGFWWEKLTGDEPEAGTCDSFKFEPRWKQALFFWRGGLALGRCSHGCYGSALVHHTMPCLRGRAILSDLHAERAKP